MRKNKLCFCIVGIIMFVFPNPAKAKIKLFENNQFMFNFSSYFRADLVTFKNHIDLDNKNSDDTSTYLGIDYSLAFDLKSKDSGPEVFIKFERNGPYDYDAPVLLHNTLRTSTGGKIDRYSSKQLPPELEEFWLDLPLGQLPMRAKSGLFTYNVGNGFSLNDAYENYGLNLRGEHKDIKWEFYYCRPDLVHKERVGPHIKQEHEQGILYEHSRADFFAADVNLTLGEHKIQPYAGILLDRTNVKRASLFSTPTHDDRLGTFGFSWEALFKKLSLALEAARNFGKAKSSDEAFKDVVHSGYLVYSKASYDFGRFSPHSRFVLASGNKIETEMVEAGNTVLTSGKNRAFSVFSPFNTTLADSIYPNVEVIPLVAMGGGNGLNYGIARPGTFNDPRLFENLILLNLGLDYKLTDKLSCVLDWWYLRSKEKGVGTFGGITKKLPNDLGHEVDLSFNYAFNKNVSLSLLSGYFFPGNFYRQNRDDTRGSLFTPFIRNDGKADGAYHIELSLTLIF